MKTNKKVYKVAYGKGKEYVIVLSPREKVKVLKRHKAAVQEC